MHGVREHVRRRARSGAFGAARVMTAARVPGLAWAMMVAVIGLAALAVFDEVRESAAALDDFADEQAVAARVIAASLSASLGASMGARANDGVTALSAVVETPTSHLFLLGPDDVSLRAVDGHAVQDDALVAAVRAGKTSYRVERDEAPSLGLPERTAFAGIASAPVGLDGGARAPVAVVVVASAERERDRERRAGYRLVIGLLLTSGLVAAFGGVALRRQRKELELAHALAVTEVERRADERLESASRAATLGTMALGIAHELATPLAVIAGRAQQMLARANNDERASTSARAILDQTERIGEVVRGFLALARGQAPAAERLDARTLVDAAAGLVEHRFAKAHVTLGVDVAPGLSQVHGDARLLEQALVNLLLNACDACSAGGRVDVRAERRDALVAFVVVDDGHGISPADLAHVTEPFFTTKAHGEGTGLGLAVTLEIAKSHRGTLTLAPEEPRGTRAELCIPVAAPASPSPSPSTSSAVASASAAAAEERDA